MVICFVGDFDTGGKLSLLDKLTSINVHIYSLNNQSERKNEEPRSSIIITSTSKNLVLQHVIIRLIELSCLLNTVIRKKVQLIFSCTVLSQDYFK